MTSGYALGRFYHALQTAASHADPAVRERALAKVDAWRAVLEGLASGQLTVGSRTPVANTPAWVTLEVAHGGFATGRYLAEGPLQEHETALLRGLPNGVPGDTDRQRLNHWFLGDQGQDTLGTAVRKGCYHVAIPEEAALPVVSWLMDKGHLEAALGLVATLQPLMHRLRFYPRLESVPHPTGAVVRLSTVGEVTDALRNKSVQPNVAAMNEALRGWNPLYDRLVALWLRTVEGDAPHLQRDTHGVLVRKADNQPLVVGGWPCRRWPSDWAATREQWLSDYRAAAQAYPRCTKHKNASSNFARLRTVLERCPNGSSALTGRDVGSVRLALAHTVARHGLPNSAQRLSLRKQQAAVASRPSHAELSKLVVRRLERHPSDGGLTELDSVLADALDKESAVVPMGTKIPPHLTPKVSRALEAPIGELVDRKVIGSSEVLAKVLPQITSQVAAAGLTDPILRDLYGQLYAAFRRRRSLLLLNLEHQVRLEELPWVAALSPFRSNTLGTQAQARQTLEQVTLLALSAFPQTIVPNPLVQEMGALARSADLKLPLVEEIAADIFMGTFTMKWAEAARIAADAMQNTLYARYYDLPTAAAMSEPRAPTTHWGKGTADAFAMRCKERASEAGTTGGSRVAGNGAILEQSQILTTHNLAVLMNGLGLTESLRALAPSLVERTLRWIVRRQHQSIGRFIARLQMLKNTAYAWRQAIFFLSLCSEEVQAKTIETLETLVGEQDIAWPAVTGLRLVFQGGCFDALGHGKEDPRARRFLGWSVGRHWMLK